MGTTVGDGSYQRHQNSIRTDLDHIRLRPAKARIDPKPSEQKEVLAVIRTAMSAVGLSQKAMAITAGCTESELSDALNGRENRRFDAEWLWKQDDTFLLRFLDEMTERRQLTKASADVIRRKRIIELIDLLLQVA